MEKLLNQVQELQNAFQTEEKYNLFEVLNITRKEVIICRFLTDLLNPKGKHGRSIAYIKSFFVQVLEEEHDDTYYEQFRVFKEFELPNRRRIDIVLQSQERFIPIEVKIDASDETSQCWDYYQYAKELDEQAKIIYLTKTGYEPSEESKQSEDGTQTLQDNNILCISFEEDILTWLRMVIADEKNDVNKVISQFVEAMERECGIPEQKEINAICNYVLEDENRLQNALTLCKVMDDVKARLLMTFMEELEQALDAFLKKPSSEKYHLKKEMEYHYYEYQQQADSDFYIMKHSTDPGINYVFENIKLKRNRQVWFRVEVNEFALCAGLYVIEPTDTVDNGLCEITNPNIKSRVIHELHKKLNLQSVNSDNHSWITQFYLPTGEDEMEASISDSMEQVPNFKEMNTCAIKLTNPQYRRKVIEKSVKVIEQKLEELFLLDDED